MVAEAWLALEFPRLALDLVTRAGTATHDVALAVTEGDGRRQVVTDANPAARQLGVKPAMPVGAALGLAGELTLRTRDFDAETRALGRLAAWCYQYSALVSVDADIATLLLEAAGSRRLFGEPAELSRRLVTELLALGYRARGGTGPTPEAARLAAERGLAIDGSDELERLLRRLPLDALRLPHDQAQSLARMGFRQVAELLRLPRKSLARRLGPALVDYLDRLRGTRPDPRRAWQPPERYASELDLAAEIVQGQGLLFPLQRMVKELCGVLRGGDRGVQDIAIELVLREGRERFRLGLHEPGQDEARIMALLRERLERLRLPAPVRCIRLETDRLLPFESHSGSLFRDAPEAGGESLGPLLERLCARLGQGAVRGLGGVEEHRPERSWSTTAPGRVSVDCPALPHRPLWLYHPPRRCRIEDYSVLAGPERIESGWWDGHDCRRDYFVVRDRHGSTLWAYREYKPEPGWYLHGLFG